MKRGEIYSVAQRGVFTGKPRPALVIQSDTFERLSTTVFALITTTDDDASAIRVPIEPSPINKLRERSFVMVHNLNTVKRENVGEFMGTLNAIEYRAVETALMLFLGIGRVVDS